VSKPKKQRDKRYNPNKSAQLQYDQIKRTTFYYHGDWADSPGALVGNMDHAISSNLARIIMSRPNTWAGMLLAFVNDGNSLRVETELFWHTREIKRDDMQRALNRRESQWIERFNQNQLISSGWLMVPDHRVDLAAQEDWIIQEFRRNGADSEETTTMGAIVRIDRIHAQDAEKQEAA
tara:strand:+ start:36756 stop:37289 length:534 start_codon:yes stop_codon:yes gene_type:complete